MTTASVPVVESVATELLAGKTITEHHTGSAVPQNPTNANDRDHATKSVLQAGFAPGTIVWGWKVDLGSAQTVNRMRVWDPVGADYVNDPSNLLVQFSDNNSTWTTAATTYSSASVASGYPASPTATEYRYALTSPSSHRYWRLYQTAGGGLFSGRGISEWFADGTTTVGSDVIWHDAPDTVDGSDATSDDVEEGAITETAGPFWRFDNDTAQRTTGVTARLGFEDAGSVTLLLQGATVSDFSDATTLAILTATGLGSLAAQDLDVTFDEQGPYQYYQLVLDSATQDIRVVDVALALVDETDAEPPPNPGHEPGRAILEIYVHDEDASRWGTATWATGPATGTEGIWSAAGWQDVTPEGVNAHIIWGSRQPSRGILAQQGAASWNVQTYDPDRILDPGNFDSPYYPQLVAGVPIRISHDSLVIRTGYVDEFHYKHKSPDYQGQMLCTDTWSLLNQAKVPADSILGNTLLGRIQDAINAAGIAVGGIPLPPSGPAGPTIADWVEGAATDDPTSVGDHIRNATDEVLWVPFIAADAGLGLRPWGAPLDRGREIDASNLEDLEAISSEDGLYSVVSVMPDPAGTPIIRKATPLPRYGERVWERTEPTVDPEGYAAAILAERPWPGVQYIPGAIHCFTRADVDYFGSLEIMERVTITVAGAVSVQGRILGGELFVEHRARDTKGAKWIFKFEVATDGATAIGLTTLVASGTGETLLDSASHTDYLEAS